MKKIIVTATCGMLFSGVACADLDFYVGGDVGVNKFKYGTIKSALNTAGHELKSSSPSIGALAGIKFHENFSTEVGFALNKKIDISGNAIKPNMKSNNFYFDVVGNMPLCNCFDLLGAVGVGSMKVKYNTNGLSIGDFNSNFSKSKAGIRLGVGAQYNITNCFAARVMFKHQKVGMKYNTYELMKRATSFNFGLTYTI